MTRTLEKRNGLRNDYGLWDPFAMARDLLRWEPATEYVARPATRGGMPAFAPQFEVKASGDQYVLTADLPGVKEDDVDINLHGNVLTVRGERRAENEKEDETYYVYERSYGSFERSFTLPDEADGDAIEARLDDGVLTVTIPKRPESKPKKIALKK